MKIDLYLTAVLFSCLILSACEKEDFRYQNDFEKSYREWLNFKESSDNSYRYMVTDGTWAGFGWQTTLTVENGEVVQREFRYTTFNSIAVPPGGWTEQRAQEILDSLQTAHPDYATEVTAQELAEETAPWTEEGAGLDTHESSMAASLRTLDDIYDRARNHWLIKREDANTSFEAKNNGLLSSCGFWMDGCQDDCFVGVTIAFIEPLN